MFKISRLLNSPSAAPSIKEPLKDKIIKEGEPVEFSIQVVGNPIPTVQWFLNGKELSNSPDFQIFSKDDVHTLRISEVFDEDKGLYTVLAKNKYGETTDRARLKVSVTQYADDSASKHARSSNWNPTSASSFNASAQPSLKNVTPVESRANSGFLKPLVDKTSEAGEDIILECNLPPFPVASKITWYKDGIEITRTIPSIRTSMQQGVCRLVIERADTSHSGKYVCKAQLKENLYETSMLLTVRDKLPVILPDSKYSPSVTLDAKKPDASSKFDTSFQVAPFESSLKSQDFQGKSADGDPGFSARNSAAPQFVKKLESSLLVENSSSTFSCRVTGEPAPNIQWYHNGRLIRPSGKYRMKLNKDGGCSLMVTDCNKQDAGFYTCCALNVTGRDVCSAELMTEGANDIDTTSYVEPDALKRMLTPKSSTKTEEVYAGVVESLSEPSFSKSCATQVMADEGETARIECKVYGHPSPDLSWYKNGKEVRRGGRFQVVTNQEGMQSLVIKLVQCSDAGIYTCRAHNKSGQATMDFTLQVEDVSSKYQSKIYLSRNAPSVRQADVVPPSQSPSGYSSLSKVFSDSTKLKMSSKQAEVQRSVENELSLQSLPPIRNSSSPKPLDHFPPRFLVTPDPVTANEGGYAKFWAKVSANPPATVTWFINGLEIFTSSRFNVYFDGLMHVLEIMKVKNFDDGEVKATARNYKGDVQHAVRLSVADAINLRTHLHPSTDALQSKKRSLPSIEITPTKGESFISPIKTEGRSISIKTKSDVSSCPLFLEKLCKSVKVKDGEEVVLTCVVVGNPTPEVSWLKNGKPVSIYEDYTATYDQHLGVARLVVSDCLPGDCGRFTCVAKNDLGCSQTECLLSLENSFTKAKSEDPSKNKSGRAISFKVLKELLRSDATVPQSDKDKNQYSAPSFTKQLSDGEVNDGDQLVLSACFEGSPFPSISWFFNDKPIQPNSDFLVTVDAYKKETSLKIVEVFPEDNGIYSCRATNVLGVATTSCNLIVKYDKTMTTTDVVSAVEISEERKFSEIISLSGSSTPVQFSTPPITKNSEIHFRNSPVFKGMTIEMEIPEVISQKEIQLRRRGEAVGTVRQELQVNVEAKEREKTEGIDLILNPLKTPDPVRKKRRAQAVQSKSLVIEKSIPVFVEPLEQIVSQSKGKLLELKCQVFSATPASVDWYHKNELLTDELTVRSSFDSKSGLIVLRFPSVQQRHAGPYRCIVKNLLGSASCNTELFIKDEIIIQPPSQHDHVDQMMQKTPEMTDHKPSLVTSIAKVCFASIEELKQLEAEKQVNVEDAIDHQDRTAVAKTSVVEKESAYLLETFKQHKVLPCSETIHLSECKEQTLLCKISPVSPKMSLYLKTLRHAAVKNVLEVVDQSEARVLPSNPAPLEELTLETHFPMETILCDPHVLNEATPPSIVGSPALEKDETSSDEDIFYDCMEFEEKGKQAEHLVTSSVKDKKTFLNITGHPPESIDVLEGQSFVLECHFEGSPLPKVIWLKNDLEIKSDERTSIENYDSKSILITDPALPQDDSTYSCRVQNRFHSAETLTRVLVDCGSHSGFVKKDDSTKEIEQETVKLPLKDGRKTYPEHDELKGKESAVSSHGADLKDQKNESSFDSAKLKKDLKSSDSPFNLRDSLNQEIMWHGKADKEKLKPDIPREVDAKELKELDKAEPFPSFDSKLKNSEIKSYARFGSDDKSRKVSDERGYKSFENQARRDDTTDGMGQSADEKQETLSKKLRTEGKELKTSTHKDDLKDSQTERSRTTAKDNIRNKSPEEFSLGKKIKSSETDGSRSQNESSFFQKSMKSTTTTETTEYKWKQLLEGNEEDSERHIGEADKGPPSIESSETFYRKEESDHKSIEESRQKLHLKSDLNQRSKDLIQKDTVYNKTKDGHSKEVDKKEYKIESNLDSGDKSHLKGVTEDVDVEYKSTLSDDIDHMEPQIKEEPNEDNLCDVNAEEVGGAIAGTSEYEKTEEQKDAPREGEDEPLSSTSEEERAREQKYISTLTEEITFKDVNNVPQKFSTRLLKTVEYTKTNSIKSSTKDMPDVIEEDSRSKPPYVRHAMSEFQWDIQDSEDKNNLNKIGDRYKKWREDASMEISDNNHQIYNEDSVGAKQNEYSLNEYGEYYTSNSIRHEKSPENLKHLSSYIDKASGNHLEISNKGVQYDSTGKIATREAAFDGPVEKSVTVQDIETTDEITVETKVTQVKTVSMQLSESGDINLTETTQVQTDTDMKETKKTREREELVVSHLVSNITEVLDQSDPNVSDVTLQEEQNAESVSEKYDLFSTWNIEPGVLIAIHSYEPDSDEVMSLHEGERLEFLEENSEDWWFVRKFFDNRQGFVPSRLLQMKEDFDKNVSDKIAQQIDRLEDSLSTKFDDHGQESPPHMVNLLEDVSVHDGESASFKCLVSGNPRPSITWFHNSKIVKPSPDFLQFYDPDFVSSLSIREVFPEDGGRYTMIAKNPFGIASSSAELLVVENEYIREKEETRVSESPVLVVQPKHLVLDEGSTAKFSCKFKGKFPMKATWYKDGGQVSSGDKTKFDVMEEDGEFITVELTLGSVDESHTGKYRVLVTNDHGETEALTSLVINALPKTLDFKANLKKTLREPDTNVTFKQERILEEKSKQERLHSHTEANSSFGSSEVIQHDFRNVLKPFLSTNPRY